MTWTIWINFLPLSHGVPHEIWLQLAQWFQRRYLKTHTHTHTHILAHQNTTAESCSRWNNVGFEGKVLYFCGAGEWGAFFFFQSSGQLAFVKMYNFLQVMILLKNAVCSNGICWNEKKKFLLLEEGSPEKKNSYVSAMVVVLTDKLTL